MEWLINLFTNTDSIAHIVVLYSLVIAAGMILGRFKIFGISLGVTFVLFAGIVAGHIGFTGTSEVLNFVQDFGLILFVYCIGLQVGPGFFESFAKGGVTANLLALGRFAIDLILRELLTIAIVHFRLPFIDQFACFSHHAQAYGVIRILCRWHKGARTRTVNRQFRFATHMAYVTLGRVRYSLPANCETQLVYKKRTVTLRQRPLTTNF